MAAPLAVGGMLPRAVKAAAPLRRLAVLDYGLAETLLLLNVTPLALVGAQDWDRWVVEPPLPSSVVNLGSSREPNLELLQQLKPDAILSTPYLAGIVHRLERIATVLTFPTYVPGGRPLTLAADALSRLAELTGRAAEGTAALASADAAFAAVRARLAAARLPPLHLASFMDARHVRLYGANSLFGEVLEKIGLVNAYKGPTNFWGFTTVGIETLPTEGDGRFVYFDPVPPGVLPALAANPIWTNLPFVKANRVTSLPPVLMFGGLPSAMRFARLLAGALAQEAPSHG